MACILLTDMDPPSPNPATHLSGLLSVDPNSDPKQETEATCLTVHLYNPGKVRGGANCSENMLTFPPGEYVAEELCITAAKACGESLEDFSSYLSSLSKYHFIYSPEVNLLSRCQAFA